MVICLQLVDGAHLKNAGFPINSINIVASLCRHLGFPIFARESIQPWYNANLVDSYGDWLLNYLSGHRWSKMPSWSELTFTPIEINQPKSARVNPILETPSLFHKSQTLPREFRWLSWSYGRVCFPTFQSRIWSQGPQRKRFRQNKQNWGSFSHQKSSVEN